MTEDVEFEEIRAAIEAAANVMAGAIDKHGGGSWDYMVVAVPHRRATTRIAMMASLMPDVLPLFLNYIAAQLKAKDIPKIVEVNGVPQDVKPS